MSYYPNPSPPYRWVANYGYGDKSWLYRDLGIKEAIECYNQEYHTTYTKLVPEMFDSSRTHYLEGDEFSDVEDWDPMDS